MYRIYMVDFMNGKLMDMNLRERIFTLFEILI